MVTRYETGRRAEYRARDQMLNDGFHSVLRTAGSHGPVDLVGVSAQFVKFVQVKSTRNAKASFATELAALCDWQVPEGCVKELWVWIVPQRKWVMVPA